MGGDDFEIGNKRLFEREKMKIYWFISVLLGQLLMAGELEVRAYRAEAKNFKYWIETTEEGMTALLERAVYGGLPMKTGS